MKVELTQEQVNTLVCYILTTTRHREKEREAWEELAKEMNEDGTPKFKHAESNAEYYAKLEEKLTEIKIILDNARWTKVHLFIYNI